MQPIVLGPYTVEDADSTFYANAAWDGAGPFYPSTTTTPDGLAHQVTLTVATDDYSSVDFTLIGLDANGNSITETLAGPNNNTVTSTKYFSQLTEVTVSASFGGGPGENSVSAGFANPALMKVVPLDARSVAPALIGVDISGTIDYTVKQTPNDVFVVNPEQNCSWFSIAALATKTSDLIEPASVGARGIQLLINSATNPATIKLSISQASSALG
jgi:hypothetical protein